MLPLEQLLALKREKENKKELPPGGEAHLSDPPSTLLPNSSNNEPGVMKAGMTFTIEPMLTLGRPRQRMWKDGWTAVTVDGSLTAQYEHTLLITETGVEVLTLA